jgi:hypothetical protein
MIRAGIIAVVLQATPKRLLKVIMSFLEMTP